MKKGRLIFRKNQAKAWELSFNLRLLSIPIGWYNILNVVFDSYVCFTPATMNTYGCRNPSLFLDGTKKMLSFLHCVNGSYHRAGYKHDFEAKSHYTPIRLRQEPTRSSEIFKFTINIDGKTVYETYNKDAREWKDVAVYASDALRPAPYGYIKNVELVNLPNRFKD